MMNMRGPGSCVAMLLVVLMCLGISSFAAPDIYHWTGKANHANGNWNDSDYWDGATWPGNGGDSDEVIIDDTTPTPTVIQNVVSMDLITSVFIGDGHTLVLSNPLLLSGTLEFEGAVVLTGSGALDAEFLLIYADQETSIDFASGGGHMSVIENP